MLKSKGGPKIKEKVKSLKTAFGECNINVSEITGIKDASENEYIKYFCHDSQLKEHGPVFYISPNSFL